MALSRFVNSFRVRLLVLLAILLVLTVSVQYYVNLRAVRSNTDFIVQQQRAIMAGVALGMNAITSKEYLYERRDEVRFPLLGEQSNGVEDVLIVDEEGNIRDSLDKNQAPKWNADKTAIRYDKVRDIPWPPVKSAVQLPELSTKLPNVRTAAPAGTTMDEGAFYFPVDTDKGRRYVIVILGSANSLTSVLERQSRRSMLWTLGVLLVTTCLTAVVVWRFTRPIKFLSTGARRVAGGDFTFRVPTTGRDDEMGELTQLFNDMTIKLGRTRELEAQLYNAEKAVVVSRLASAIAHEIRNPLNYINLTLDHLRATFAPADPKKQEKFDGLTRQLKAEVARINTRITEFLNYSRPPKLDFKPLDVADLARDSLRMFGVQADESNVQTTVTQTNDVPAVVADAESLRSALTNLVINSLQSMDGSGGKIFIALSSEDKARRVRVEVSDTGRGIKADDISKIFEPDYSTKETGPGLG